MVPSLHVSSRIFTRWRGGLLLLAALAVFAVPVGAQQSARSSRIAFVHLRFSGEQAELIDLKVAQGRLKPRPAPTRQRLELQVLGTSGAVLWQGSVEDPATRMVEAPDGAGGFVQKVVTVAKPELTLRVPFFESGQRLRISRVRAGNSPGAGSTLLGELRLHEP